MTPFTPLDFMESGMLNNIFEENIISSGGSGKVYRVHHPSLHGLIEDRSSRIMVVKKKGSLDDWLHHHDRKGAPAPLDWLTRLTIAIDASRGLNYIHKECRQAIIHRDIKSGNILFDPEFHAKIADFRLARMVVNPRQSHHRSAIFGTHGYMAPDENLKSSKASQTFLLRSN
ncbi:Receptor protein kinase CLAVATA1 [Triticum urartu]|uniref:non-specific serine/threonine protein kinase n=1 Tax=Triticum urartu TaxID=4572 RepID=M7YPX4_TRIUA|nr:Receptor protein kinase CLAVATA1 [Triticum urartu]